MYQLLWAVLVLGLAQAPAPPRALTPQQTKDVIQSLHAAVAAQRAGQLDAARRHLVDALARDPSLTNASLLLGDVLYATGDLTGAIETYQRALTYAPEHKLLTARLDGWRREQALHDRFGQKLGDHFTVLFEGPAEEALAQKAVEILEAAYWRIGSALYTYPSDVITVVLYTREQFRDVTQSPDWAGGAFDGRIRVPVQGAMKNPREFERVLAHEFTHALVRSLASRGVPQWLDEGLAMNFEGSALGPQTAPLKGSTAAPPLSAIERSFGGLDRERATLAYAVSGAAVKLLLDDVGAPAVVGLLTDLGDGTPFADAFARHIQISYAGFQKRLLETTAR